MNVFENLVEELKEENLLEETVIESSEMATATLSSRVVENIEDFSFGQPDEQQFESQNDENIVVETGSPSLEGQEADLSGNLNFESNESIDEELSADESDFEGSSLNANDRDDFTEKLVEMPVSFEFASTMDSFGVSAPFQTPVDEMEFYRRRAIDEVSSLQMVEHVFSGVEREQMRILPKPFNDIAVKKALHDFLQVSKNSSGSENAQAEFKLMQETESWCSALSHRDKHLSVSAIRRYCETTKPVLSKQALVALARFYRNLPHSESVRSKFDMILTRLFTREVEGEKRELMFSREEIIKQINELYADWASVQLYSEEDETDLLLTTVKFDDFLAEAQGAESFDELVKNDFYNRLRLFKESISDKFYAPMVLASAIESNVLIGNRYVELLENERKQTSAEAIESQYSFLLDQAISDATSKTLQLVELLKDRNAAVATTAQPKKLNEPKETLVVPEVTEKPRKRKSSKLSFFGVSQWLVLTLFGVIALSAGLYIYVEYFSAPKSSSNVQKVNVENSSFKDYLTTARIDQETLIGVVSPAWDSIGEDKKLEMLGKLLNIGKEKGFKKAHLLNNKGETVGYANDTETKVINAGSL